MRFGERTAAEICVRFLGDVRTACEVLNTASASGDTHT